MGFIGDDKELLSDAPGSISGSGSGCILHVREPNGIE
jgi:hypothetical protein